jgi:hypothetical protein
MIEWARSGRRAALRAAAKPDKAELEAQMRGFFLAAGMIAAAVVAPAAAAGPLGGSAPGSGGAATIWTPPGGEGGSPSGRNGPGGHGPGPAWRDNHSAPNVGGKPSGRGVPLQELSRRHGQGDASRRRPRHYWFGGGPVFVPEPGGDYVYSDDDYDDGSDPTGCQVYRKVFDHSGHFLGWVRVNLCEGQ